MCNASNSAEQAFPGNHALNTTVREIPDEANAASYTETGLTCQRCDIHCMKLSDSLKALQDVCH